MDTIIKHIILDVSVNKYVSVLVKENDAKTRKIIAKVTDNGKPYSINNTIIPRIKCSKADNTIVVNDCIILDNGNIEIDITEQITACAGQHDCELILFSASTDQVLHTMNFIINVKESACSDEDIISSNEFNAFEDALLRADMLRVRRITESEIDTLFG